MQKRDFEILALTWEMWAWLPYIRFRFIPEHFVAIEKIFYQEGTVVINKSLGTELLLKFH
jgi:hypothetical protein